MTFPEFLQGFGALMLLLSALGIIALIFWFVTGIFDLSERSKGLGNEIIECRHRHYELMTRVDKLEKELKKG